MPASSLLPVYSRSLTASMTRGRWWPLVNLVWLAWLVAAPWAFGETRTEVVVLTFASLPVFLVCYYRAWYGDPARLRWNTTAIAALGLVIIPVNTCWSYLIYASVLIPYCTSARATVGWLALLMTAFAAVAAATGFPPALIGWAVLMCVVAAMFSLVGRVSGRRDAALRLSHDEVRRLAAAAERERIGRDLHDLLGHTLSLIAVKSELARRLVDRDVDAARSEVADIEQVARAALAEVRDAVTGIRAAELVAELASARLLLETSDIALIARVEAVALPAAVESALALGLREAATNVQRHARARRVEVTFAREGRDAVLTVRDDGRGGASLRGNGLNGVAERLHAIGGRLAIDSPPGGGSRLVLRVPLQRERWGGDVVAASSTGAEGESAATAMARAA